MVRKSLSVAGLLLLIILAAGSILDPYWWYRLTFERRFDEWSLWKEAFAFAFNEFALSILFMAATVYLILILQRTTIPDRMLEFTKTTAANYLMRSRAWCTVAILITVIGIGIWTSPSRSTAERSTAEQLAKLAESSRESQRKLDELLAPNKKLPLSDPTIFLFLDKDLVDSLYGQKEPEVVLSEVEEEVKTTDTLSAKVDIEKILETTGGRERFQRRLAMYKATPKATERKLRDLVWYMREKNLISSFSSLEFQSDELKSLDAATQQLAKYGIAQDQVKLRALRDKLLAIELAALEKRLTNLKGLILIEGDWSVQASNESYTLKKPFAPDVSNPAMCEVRLHKSSLTQESRDTLDGLGGKPVRLSVFGNVTVGISPASRTVQLTPIAVY